MTRAVETRRESYTHYPRPILWLVRGTGAPSPGGETIASFYLSKLPVTNVQFEAWRAGFARAACSPGDDDPAAGLAFEDAAGYCAWYARISQKPMRLPTEAEWEHACRAGIESACPRGDELARGRPSLLEEGSATTAGLARLRPNPWGLIGMLGGVWEWTAAPGGGPGAIRGGSFRTPRAELHPGLRRPVAAGSRVEDAGFRLARSLDGGASPAGVPS